MDLKNHARMVCQITLFSIQRTSVVNEGAESAGNKLNSMVSFSVAY